METKKQLQASVAGREWVDIRDEDREYLLDLHDCHVKFRTVITNPVREEVKTKKK